MTRGFGPADSVPFRDSNQSVKLIPKNVLTECEPLP